MALRKARKKIMEEPLLSQDHGVPKIVNTGHGKSRRSDHNIRPKVNNITI